MRTIMQKLFAILSIFFFMLFVADSVLSIFLPNIKLNLEFWTPISSVLLLFSLFGLVSFIFLIIYVIGNRYRILLSIFALFGLAMIWMISVFAAHGVYVIQNDHHRIYVVEERFIFGGRDFVYEHQNFFYSKKIGSYENSEDYFTSYNLVGDTLVISETGDRETNINLNE